MYYLEMLISVNLSDKLTMGLERKNLEENTGVKLGKKNQCFWLR